jgi:hypothetical protein
MGPLSAFFALRGRDPEDMKMGHLSPEREHAVMALREKLARGDDHGPIYLDHSLPEMPPPEHALMGGFYQQPMGAAPPTMPFRPPGQGMSEPPPAMPPAGGPLAQFYRGR